MKIPMSKYEITGHRPTEVASYSTNRLNNSASLGNKMADLLPVKVRQTGDKALAQRIRNQFIGLSIKSLESAAANKPAGPTKMMQAASGDSSWAAKNENVANEAIKSVRLSLYNKNFGSYKSDNKRNTTKLELEAERMQQGEFGKWGDFGNITDLRHISAIRSFNIWKSTLISCDGLSNAVKDYVSYKHPNVQVSSLSLPGHTLAAVGTIPPECINLPLAAWPKHLYMCDPWANIVCPAPEYPAKFAEKMEKWKSDHKQIRFDNDTWIDPTDDKWLSCVNEPPKVYTRQSYQNGQFADSALTAPPIVLPKEH